VHQRKNRYEAVVTVAARDGAWKIVDLELRDEKRVDQAGQPPQDRAAPVEATPSVSGG
jgi:hypothetical protein